MIQVAATVVISTLNRKEELAVALRSAVAQSIPVEVLVVDDGSRDGTADLIRTEFPRVRVIRHETPQGYIASRNEGARLATGEILFSIDDDAEFSSPFVVEQTLQDFHDPRIGAVAIPFIEPHKQNAVLQHAPDAETAWVTDSYVGTAHALRRDLFLSLGGYRTHLVHQGEERDLSIRMLDRGRVVRLGTSDLIRHHESPKRDRRRMDYYGRRNDILFAWENVPLPWLPLHCGGTTLNGLRAGLVRGGLPAMLRGIAGGYGSCLRYWSERAPVAAATYHLARRLRKEGPLRLDEIESSLRPHSEPSHDSAAEGVPGNAVPPLETSFADRLQS